MDAGVRGPHVEGALTSMLSTRAWPGHTVGSSLTEGADWSAEPVDTRVALPGMLGSPQGSVLICGNLSQATHCHCDTQMSPFSRLSPTSL